MGGSTSRAVGKAVSRTKPQSAVVNAAAAASKPATTTDVPNVSPTAAAARAATDDGDDARRLDVMLNAISHSISDRAADLISPEAAQQLQRAAAEHAARKIEGQQGRVSTVELKAMLAECRTALSSSAASASSPSIDRIASKYGVDPDVLRAVMKHTCIPHVVIGRGSIMHAEWQ